VPGREGSVARCPRCQAVVAGDYKFCPACAFRLRVDVEEPAAPPPPRSPWKTGFLVATAVSVVLAGALLAVAVFAPGVLGSSVPGTKPTPPSPGEAALKRTPIGVETILEELVELETGGYALDYSLSLIPDLPEDFRERVATQLAVPDIIEARIPYAPRFMKWEVTCGQYADFLEDVFAHRDRIPDYWRRADAVERREDVDVYDHVPSTWLVLDSDGTPVGWRLDPDDRNLPVTRVSVVDASGFAEWASDRLHVPLRLPLAMEWTRAACGGRRDSPWPWGSERLVYACNNYGIWQGVGHTNYVHQLYGEPVGGGGGATSEGLLSMAGNVAEWALDHDIEVREQVPVGEPYVMWKALARPSYFYYVFGGSFRSGIDDCQVTRQERVLGVDRSRDDVGFRLVVDPK
jgi:formylglycine-generating enzyme required for sulfatase activity